jgi:ABC-type sugar transport system ATPase subunit
MQWERATAPSEFYAKANSMILEAKNISKSYIGVSAVSSVNFSLEKGETHGLVGANGAGKSTLAKLLSGAEKPNKGNILFNGQEVHLSNPRDGLNLGIAVLHQEPALVPEMTAVSNVFLGSPIVKSGILNRAEMERQFFKLSKELELSIPHDIPVCKLPVPSRQMVDILRAVQARHKVFFMDEPTASLDPKDRQKLYNLIERLRKQGASIVFISHDLTEVLSICSKVSVMRDGYLIDSKDAKDWDKESLVSSMMGNENTKFKLEKEHDIGDVLFEVRNLSVPGKVENISFEVHKGEVLGIAGLVGAGRTELLWAIAGADTSAAGQLRFNGNWLTLPRSVRDAQASGIVMVPEDRKSQGLFFKRTVHENLALPNLKAFAKYGLLDRRKMMANFKTAVENVKLAAYRLMSNVETLSGGNQQKVVLAKYLLRHPKLLLLDEPSRGVDIVARNEIFESIIETAKNGMGIILVSSDINEVLEYSDRILVMLAGKNVGVLSREDADLEKILKMQFSVSAQVK